MVRHHSVCVRNFRARVYARTKRKQRRVRNGDISCLERSVTICVDSRRQSPTSSIEGGATPESKSRQRFAGVRQRFAGVRLGFRFSLWWTGIVDSCQPFPAHNEFLIVFVTQSWFAGRLEVVAVESNRFFEKEILVQTFGPGCIFSQRIRFENQHIGCGHAKVGLLRP